MDQLLYDTNFWVLISFVIFIGVFIKYGKAQVLSGLDKRIDEIKNELDVAEKLRVDAQELLAEYQRKQKDAIGEAERIIQDAKNNAEALRQKAEDDLQKSMSRREQQLNDRLKRIEDNARQEVEAYTAQIAINAARSVLNEKIDSKIDKNLQEETLKQASKTLN
jgi:F-type H+-transporting ATPase subunit b